MNKISNPFYKLGFKDVIFSWVGAVVLGVIALDFLVKKLKEEK